MNAVVDTTQLQGWEVLLFRAAHAISLSKPQYDLIEQRYGTLQGILDRSTDPLLKDAHIFVQGSVRLKTTTCPAPGATDELATIDADAVVWLPNAGNATAAQVLVATEKCFRAGVRVDAPIEPLRRGIRIVYADEQPGFHIDVTPARPVSGNGQSHGQGALEVPDRHTGWKPSSPIPYADWLGHSAGQRITVVGLEDLRVRKILLAEATQEPLPEYDDYIDANPLRAAIKLLKRHRDAWSLRTRQVKVRPISAVITTLTTRAYLEVVAETAGGVRQYRPIEALIQVVERMPKFIRHGLSGWEVHNPEDPGENFAEKWNRPYGEGHGYRTAFDAWHAAAVTSMRIGLHDLGSTSAFADAFNADFGTSRSLITETLASLPGDWTVPGRKPGFTKSWLSLETLSGSAAASSTSQAAVQPVGRLG